MATAKLTVNVFDGTRQLLAEGVEVLVRIHDGNHHELSADFHKLPTITFEGLPVFDNFGDDYTVIVSASGYEQAGFRPVKVSSRVSQVVDIMLLPKKGEFNFKQARWSRLKNNRPTLFAFLSHPLETGEAPENLYSQLMETNPAALAALLNITTALEAIHLRVGNPLSYFRQLIWDSTLQPDRFFAYAVPELLDLVKLAEAKGVFTQEHAPGIFHPGGTISFKQVQFGEANVQLTFHEKDTKVIDGITCLKVESDIDYFRDPLSHAFLEVIVNGLTGTLTNPRNVYALRWMAGRHEGIPEFDPSYTIDKKSS